MEVQRYKPRKLIPGQFGKLLSWITFSGLLTHLKPSELKILHVLAVHADNARIACVQLWVLEIESGVTMSSIPKITDQLEVYGLIKKIRYGNRGAYLICDEVPDWMTRSTYYFRPKARSRRPKALRDPFSGRFHSTVSEMGMSHSTEDVVPNVSESAESLTTDIDESLEDIL